MTNIDRTRRNLVKAVTLLGGALVATATPRSEAQAQWGGGHGHGGGGGGDDGGGGDNACFRRGTLILTVDGYRPIETLKMGDRLATRFSGTAAIKAISSFTMSRSGIKGEWPEEARPVLVKRGAMGDNLPIADLCLTAVHAVFKDGFLVPVGDLVNGASIVFTDATGLDSLEFFHIELEHHDIISANGAPCESLRYPDVEPCVPVLSFCGGRSQLKSRLRSAVSPIVDRRQPLDLIRDELEERGREFAQAA